jgi:hypothetical protein
MIEAEQLRLPAAFYDVDIPVPDGWTELDVGYVCLSPAYDAAAAEATSRGWTVQRLAGLHLDIVRQPEAVVETILAATRRDAA